MAGFASASLIVDNQAHLCMFQQGQWYCSFFDDKWNCMLGAFDRPPTKKVTKALFCQPESSCQGKIQQFYDIDKKKIGEGSYGSVCKARNKAGFKEMRSKNGVELVLRCFKLVQFLCALSHLLRAL